MEEERQKRSAQSLANRKLLRRTIFLICICGVAMFIPLVWKLWDLQINRHDELEQMAVEQQTGVSMVTANRGTIYDTNGNVLAISSTAYDVVISPKAISEKQAELDEARAEAQQQGDASKVAENDKNVEDLVVYGMAAILGLDESNLRERCQDTDSQYKLLASRVDNETEEAVRDYISENDLSGCIYLQSNSRRYYPYSTMAAQIIGFTNDEGGAFGLEASFDAELTGTDGRVVSTQSASGTALLNFYQDYSEAEDGRNLHLTLDTNIQSICETMLAEGIEKYEIQNGGCIIVMDCNSGAILGMASSPSYDPNDYAEVLDEDLLESCIQEQLTQLREEQRQESEKAALGLETSEGWEPMTEEELQAKAEEQGYAQARNLMWSNKAVNDSYEPGSTFKPLILAAALEEGVTYPEETFTCTGSLTVADYEISCSNKYGHGVQDLATAVGNSCNPVFMTLGLRLGAETFYQYLEAFGIATAEGDPMSTGIDLPGESGSNVWPYSEVNITNIATASFGQRLEVTPIQLITAVNTVINGGYYYQPYVVDYVEDYSGSITYSADTTPLRQVISESTSATCREMLEGVVANGMTGKNAYRAGYRIGGKTGTSETYVDGEYIVSFIGFAPADDPQVIALVIFDTPANTGDMYTPNGQYISGGNMAAPVAGDLLVSVLDYLNYGKQYTAEELSGADTIVPYVTNCTLAYAEAVCEEYGFIWRVVGDEDLELTVRFQTAAGGAYIPEGSEVVLYTGSETPPESVIMPDLTGMSPEEVTGTLSDLGLYLKATGTSKYYGNETVVYSQGTDPGEEISPGSVITVTFIDVSETGSEVDVLDQA